MNFQQRFYTVFAALANMCGANLTKDMVAMYEESLSDLGFEKISTALTKIMNTRRAQDRFPSIRDIRDLCEPDKVSIDVAAQEALNLAISAVARFGYYDPEGAEKYLGPEVWAALPGRNGWKEFCVAGDERMGGLPIAVARSQLRDRIKAKLSIANPDGRVSIPKAKVLQLRSHTVLLAEDSGD